MASNWTQKPRILWLGTPDSCKALVNDLLAQCDQRARLSEEGKPVAPQLPTSKLNEILSGGLAIGLTVLHGAPGAGKSAFAWQTACECGCPALVVSAELPATELLLRLTARVTETPRQKLLYMPREQLAPLLQRAIHSCPHVGIVDLTRYVPPQNGDGDGRGTRTLWEVLADFVTALVEYNDCNVQAPYPLLVVDSVHTIARLAGAPDVREYDRLSDALTSLDTIARHFGVAVLGVAERNREAMQGGGITAAAGHRLFEYVSEAMLSLDVERDNNQNPVRRADDAVKLTMRVLKNRNGELAEVALWFNGKLMRFTED
jgi:predicted ATP-dependent serine protease